MPRPNDRDATGSGSGFRVTDRAQRRRDAPISGPFSDHPGIPPPGLSAYRVDPILAGAAGPVVDPEVAEQLADPDVGGAAESAATTMSLVSGRLERIESLVTRLARGGPEHGGRDPKASRADAPVPSDAPPRPRLKPGPKKHRISGVTFVQTWDTCADVVRLHDDLGLSFGDVAERKHVSETQARKWYGWFKDGKLREPTEEERAELARI
jgi:hypothetical protein